ncbi:MAG: ABC transporter permease, partial [Candidatus Bathyarchaeia archaeon]
MNFQRISALTKKELKKTFREPAVLFMIFLFPLVFVLTFGASFGGLGSSQPVYNIGVVNMDSGSLSQAFIEALANTTLLRVHTYADSQTAQNDLSQGKIQAVIVIPADFSQSLASYFAAPNNPGSWVNATVLLYLDKGSVVATQAVKPIIQNVLAAFLNQKAAPSPVNVQIASLIEAKQVSAFEFMAPGMFTFASIFLIMMVAQSFTQDRENGMLKRIRTTPITPAEFMVSQVLAYMLIALIQAVLVFVAVYLMGFRPAVSFSAYLLAFVFILVFSLSNVGFGLITATVSKTSGAATGISFLFVLPQLFLGTFVGASLS